MTIRIVFILISSVLTLTAGLPYIYDILKGKTKPRVVTWFVWSVLSVIATAAAFVDHQYASAILTLCELIESVAVVILGLLMAGILAVEKFDIICLVGALVGLVAWWVFDSPSVAILATVLIDLIGSLPTIKHMWQKPFEETWITFAMSALSGAFTMLAVTSLRITAIAWPLDIMLMNLVFVTIILTRRRQLAGLAPAAAVMPSVSVTATSPALSAPPAVSPPATPPVALTAPGKLAAASPTQTPLLTWQPVAGAEQYAIYRDGATIGMSAAASHRDITARDGTYRYHVTAMAAGQEGPPSSDTTVVVDQTPPALSFALSREPNAAGWHNAPVTVTFTARDDSVGIASCSPPTTLSNDGASQSVIGHAMNYAGDSSSLSAAVNIDQSPPVLGQPVWSANPVVRGAAATLSIPAVDHLSGVAAGEYTGSKDPGAGKGSPLNLAAGQLNGDFDTNLAPGRYDIFIRARDAAGNWSGSTPTTLEVLAAPANSDIPQPAVAPGI